jgi:hypothetical protein
MQLDPPICVLTPLGAGLAYLYEGEGRSGVEWLVFIKRTGEPWFFRNPHVRLMTDTTEGIGPVSQFTEIGPLLEKQIARYQANGWLDR